MNKQPEQPPPYGFQQPQHVFAPAPIMQQPQAIILGAVAVGSLPHDMTCPSCHHQIHTRIETEATTKTYIMAFLLCIFCCWPCVCIPFCTGACQNTNHFCPNCNSLVGTYNA